MQTAITPPRGVPATQQPLNTSLIHTSFLLMWALVPLGLAFASPWWSHNPILNSVDCDVFRYIRPHCLEDPELLCLSKGIIWLILFYHITYTCALCQDSICLDLFAPYLSRPGFALRSKTQPKRPLPPITWAPNLSKVACQMKIWSPPFWLTPDTNHSQ